MYFRNASSKSVLLKFEFREMEFSRLMGLIKMARVFSYSKMFVRISFKLFYLISFLNLKPAWGASF